MAEVSAETTHDPAIRGERLLRLRDVQLKVGISRGSVYERMANGGFPRPLQIGPGSVRWRESEIDAWIAALPRS